MKADLKETSPELRAPTTSVFVLVGRCPHGASAAVILDLTELGVGRVEPRTSTANATASLR